MPEEMLLFITPPSVWSDKWCCSLAVQDLNECLSELDIKGGVYDGIYSAIHVAQPSESVIHLSRNLAFCAVGVQDMRDEKRQPAYDEYTWGEKNGNIRKRKRQRVRKVKKKKSLILDTEIWVTYCMEKLDSTKYENYFLLLHHYLFCFQVLS